MKKEGEENNLLQMANDLEQHLLALAQEHSLHVVYTDELLGTMSSLKSALNEMGRSFGAFMWEEGKLAQGKVHRMQATLRLLSATHKISQEGNKELNAKLSALLDQIQHVIDQ